jgi:sugar phosphate permease
VRTQLITVIPYACAFLTVLVLGIVSDKVNMKGPFLILTLTSAIVGYAVLLTNVSDVAKIVATCLITSGLYPSVILLITWLSINTAGFTKRGTTWAMAEIGGQCMSIMGTHVYVDPPRYIQGHSVVLAFMCSALLAVVFAMLWMRHCNRQKDKIEEEYRSRGEQHPHWQQSLEEVQDQHVSFRYIL